MHPQVRQVVHTYLRLIDAYAPGLVEGLYLIGSVALGDFRPAVSDIDYLAVTRRMVSATELAAIRRAHADLARRHRRPFFDGAYVRWRDLTRDPSLTGPGAYTHDGRLHTRIDSGCDPVAWHVLAHDGVRVRGPLPQALAVRTDSDDLRGWTRQNLDDYWKVWLQRSRSLTSKSGLACVTSWGPAWGVLGVSRLHFTLATGAITSKTGAGEYAREIFAPRWHRIIEECLRIRTAESGRSLYRNALTRRREALDFVAMVIEDAQRTA